MHNQYGHLTSESLIREALRMAPIQSPDVSQMLRELSNRLALVEGFRRGYFDGISDKG